MGWRTSVRRTLTAALALLAVTGLTGCAAHEERTETTRPLITILVHAGTASTTTGPGTAASGSSGTGGSGTASSTPSATTAASTNSLATTRSAWKALASAYTKQKGVRVKVRVTTASQYTSALRSAMAAPTPPTLFVVDGPAGAQRWRDYLADLGRSAVYTHLENRQLALRDGSTVVAVPAGNESYGIVYRADVLKKYFALVKKEKSGKTGTSGTASDKTTGGQSGQGSDQKTGDGGSDTDSSSTSSGTTVTSLSQVTSFQALVRLIEGVQAHRTELGLDRSLASGALSAGTTGTDGGWGADQLADLALGCTLGTTNSSGVVRSLDGIDPHQQSSQTGGQGGTQGTQGGSQSGQNGSQGGQTAGQGGTQKKVGTQQVKAVRCVNGLRGLVDSATAAGAETGESSSQALQDFAAGKAAFLPAGTGVWPALSKAGLKASQIGFLPARFSQSPLTKTDIADLTGQTDQTGSSASQNSTSQGSGSSAGSSSSGSASSGNGQSSSGSSSGSSSTAATLPQAATAAATTQSGFISGSEQYWAVNSQASHIDQTATTAFLDWVATSQTGQAFAQKLGLWLPYQQKAGKTGTTRKSSGKASKKTSTGPSSGTGTAQTATANPLRAAVLAYWRTASKDRVGEPDLMAKHQLAPTDAWRTGAASALRAYAASPSDTAWTAVREAFITGWRTQYLTTE